MQKRFLEAAGPLNVGLAVKHPIHKASGNPQWKIACQTVLNCRSTHLRPSNPQKITRQDRSHTGLDGTVPSYPGSSVVAGEARFETPAVSETIVPDRISSFQSQSLTEALGIVEDPVKRDRPG